MDVKLYVISQDTDAQSPRNYFDQMTLMVTTGHCGLASPKTDLVNKHADDEELFDLVVYNVFREDIDREKPLLPRYFTTGDSGELYCEPSPMEIMSYQRAELFQELDPKYYLYYRVEQGEAYKPQDEIFSSEIQSWIKDNLVYKALHSEVVRGKLIGYLFLTKAKCEVEQVPWENAQSAVDGELEILRQYCDGEVYGFQSYTGDIPEGEIARLERWAAATVRKDGEPVIIILNEWDHKVYLGNFELAEADSCWGFYGYDYLVKELKGGNY